MKVAEDGGKPISSEVPLSFLFKSTFLMTVSLSFLLSLLSFFRKYPHVTKKRRSTKTDFAPIVPGLVTCGVRVFLSFFFLGRFSPCKTRTYTALRLIDATPTLSRHLRRSPRCGSARCASSGPLQHGVPFRQTAPPAEKKHFPLAQFFLFFFLSADEGHPAEDNGEDSWDGNTRNGNVNRNWVWWVPDAPVG